MLSPQEEYFFNANVVKTLLALAKGAQTWNDIHSYTGLSRATISKALAILRMLGLVNHGNELTDRGRRVAELVQMIKQYLGEVS